MDTASWVAILSDLIRCAPGPELRLDGLRLLVRDVKAGKGFVQGPGEGSDLNDIPERALRYRIIVLPRFSGGILSSRE